MPEQEYGFTKIENSRDYIYVTRRDTNGEEVVDRLEKSCTRIDITYERPRYEFGSRESVERGIV